jgi:integrase
LIPTNVAAHAERAKTILPRIRIWEPEHLGEFLDAIAGERLAPVLHLAAFAGLRQGELVGLRWVDLDLDAGRLVVASSRVRAGKTVVTVAPKTQIDRPRWPLICEELLVREGGLEPPRPCGRQILSSS